MGKNENKKYNYGGYIKPVRKTHIRKIELQNYSRKIFRNIYNVNYWEYYSNRRSNTNFDNKLIGAYKKNYDAFTSKKHPNTNNVAPPLAISIQFTANPPNPRQLNAPNFNLIV